MRDVNARLYIAHDHADAFLPYSESLHLAEAAREHTSVVFRVLRPLCAPLSHERCQSAYLPARGVESLLARGRSAGGGRLRACVGWCVCLRQEAGDKSPRYGSSYYENRRFRRLCSGSVGFVTCARRRHKRKPRDGGLAPRYGFRRGTTCRAPTPGSGVNWFRHSRARGNPSSPCVLRLQILSWSTEREVVFPFKNPGLRHVPE